MILPSSASLFIPLPLPSTSRPNYFRLKHAALAKQMNFCQANFLTRLTHSLTLSHTHASVAGITHAITGNQQAATTFIPSTLLPFSPYLFLSLICQRKWLYYYAQTILGAALPTVCVLHIILIKVNSLRAKRKQKQKESKQRQTQKRNSVWIQMKIRNSRTATAANEKAKKGRDRDWGKGEVWSDKWTRHWVMTVLLTVVDVQAKKVAAAPRACRG